MEIWGHKLGSRIAQMRMTGMWHAIKERLLIRDNTTVIEGDVLEVFAVGGRKTGWTLACFESDTLVMPAGATHKHICIVVLFDAFLFTWVISCHCCSFPSLAGRWLGQDEKTTEERRTILEQYGFEWRLRVKDDEYDADGNPEEFSILCEGLEVNSKKRGVTVCLVAG